MERIIPSAPAILAVKRWKRIFRKSSERSKLLTEGPGEALTTIYGACILKSTNNSQGKMRTAS
jgi:hypothetical protein